MLEREIDLRPYLHAVLRAWRVILGAVLLGSIAGMLYALITPPERQATAEIFVLPTTSQVSLDPRFATRDASITSTGTQRQALVDLASSPVIEPRVADKLGLTIETPGLLAKQIEVRATSDLITITASDEDPAFALRLADAWASAYEELIIELFTGVDTQAQQIALELEGAQKRYGEAQGSLETFLARPETITTKQEVERLEGLLDDSRAAQEMLYSQYLSRTQELSLILEDARSIRAQVGGASTLADALAQLAIRTRAAGNVELPMSLQFDDPAAFTEGVALTPDDFDVFIRSLETELARSVRETTVLQEAIARGDVSTVGFDMATRARYEQELATATSRYEAVRAQALLLTEQRDLALEALKVLQAKSSELAIAKAVPNVSVRFLSSSPVPPRSSLTVLLAATVLAGGLSLLVVTGALILGEVVRRLRHGAPISGETPASDRSVDHPVAS